MGDVKTCVSDVGGYDDYVIPVDEAHQLIDAHGPCVDM